MTSHSKTLDLIAGKLGLSEEDKVLSKAAEYERLLQMKSTASSNITDTGKVVICLDLAANMFGAEFDVKTAIKYSGLKPAIYNNCKKVVENLLELDSDKLTIQTLCASLQCNPVEELADRILLEYQKNAIMEVDLNLPQYVCMAVFQACRINNVKMPKGKIIEKSRLKPGQWAKLDVEWTKFVDDNFAVAKKKRGRPAKTPVADDQIEKMDTDEPIAKEEEPAIELYDDWKNRIMEAAFKDLKLLQKADENNKHSINNFYREAEVIVEHMSHTPRRSPRKTPQKFEPYKNPNKGNGVRLLFSN